MTGDVGGDGALVEPVVIVDSEIAASDRINHVVVYPAEIRVGGLPFDDGHSLHIKSSNLAV